MGLWRHQKQAKRAALRLFRGGHDRVQIHMACGSGKTLVGCEVVAELRCRSVLLMVPTLMLVQQTIGAYRKRFGARYRFVAVCSDLAKGHEDDISDVDIEADCTTSPSEVRSILRSKRRCIVVCTYQSAAALAGLRFDIAVFDEAHRTAGRAGKPFGFALSNENVRCDRRLFMTATPRHSALTPSGEETPVFSMDDESIYGPVAFSYSFRRAIQDGVISDYRLVVSIDRDGSTKDKDKASWIAMRRAMSRYGAKKAFCFYNSVRSAALAADKRSGSSGPPVFHINGKQSAGERVNTMKAFKSAPMAVLTNARCLGEGIDAPSTDVVAFMSRRTSPIDIVQTAGRALRKAPGKKRGYIVIPLLIRQRENETAEEAAHRSGFEQVYAVVQALAEQDEILMASLRASDSVAGIRQKHKSNIIIEGLDSESDSRLRRAISIKLMAPFHSANFWSVRRSLKKSLLLMAESGSPRPSSRSSDYKTRSLGRYLRSLTSKNGTFVNVLKVKRPDWFTGLKGVVFKRELLHRARNKLGLGRSRKERALWSQRLSLYSNPKRSAYDADFTRKIRSIAPDWLLPRNDKVIVRYESIKSALIGMARRRDKRPSQRSVDLGERILATYLSIFLNKSNAAYDGNFSAAIKSAAPNLWFGRDSDAKKKAIVKFASEGKEKRQLSRDLYSALSHYVSSASKSFDPKFAKQIIKIRPEWFLDRMVTNGVVLRRLIKLAENGSPRPNPRSSDGHWLTRYTNRANRHFDPRIATVLRKVAPSWFGS